MNDNFSNIEQHGIPNVLQAFATRFYKESCKKNSTIMLLHWFATAGPAYYYITPTVQDLCRGQLCNRKQEAQVHYPVVDAQQMRRVGVNVPLDFLNSQQYLYIYYMFLTYPLEKLYICPHKSFRAKYRLPPYGIASEHFIPL